MKNEFEIGNLYKIYDKEINSKWNIWLLIKKNQSYSAEYKISTNDN